VNIDPGLTQFINNYDVVSADDELRKEYNSYAQGLLYFTGVRRMAYESGIEAGREEGYLITARKMLKKGYSVADISDITGVPAETITALSSE
jgi:predicted transposase YdaD